MFWDKVTNVLYFILIIMDNVYLFLLSNIFSLQNPPIVALIQAKQNHWEQSRQTKSLSECRIQFSKVSDVCIRVHGTSKSSHKEFRLILFSISLSSELFTIKPWLFHILIILKNRQIILYINRQDRIIRDKYNLLYLKCVLYDSFILWRVNFIKIYC